MLFAGFREGSTWSGGAPTGGVIVYPGRYFLRAYLRVVAGLGGVVVAWLALPASAIVIAACLATGGAFAVYAVQTALRRMSVISWDGEGIQVEGPVTRDLPWNDLRDVRLSYFSTRRDGSNGWMQLKIRGRHGVLRLDSDAAGFAGLVVAAMHHAERLGLDVSSATRHNAAVLVRPGGPRPS